AAIRRGRGPRQGHLAVPPNRGQPDGRSRRAHRGGRHRLRRRTLSEPVDRGHPEVIPGPVDQIVHHDGRVRAPGELATPPPPPPPPRHDPLPTEPPFDAGAAHDRATWPSPRTAASPTGAPGGPTGVAGTASDGGPSPTLLTAATRK